jgi:hypothetical protein
MRHSTAGRLGRQIRFLQWTFSRTGDALPFADLLSAEAIRPFLTAAGVAFRTRLYSPFETLWLFLSQVFDPDGTLQRAVLRYIAWKQVRGELLPSSESGAYCAARQRLPVHVVRQLARATGAGLHAYADLSWLWHRRPVKVVDGTTVSMPDTPANQRSFPQASTQKPGVGFPIARMVVLFSLAVGTVLDAAVGRYQGKQTGETALFRKLHDQLDPGDILLADRYFCSYFEIALACRRDADVVMRLHQCRPIDFRCGRRLGSKDRIVTWAKPPRPDWMDEATYHSLPETLELRITRVAVAKKGFRTDHIDIATSLLDIQEYPAADLADLYRARWHAELDLRSLKTVLAMDILRSHSPPLVVKEIWMHLLAYNLIRKDMADAARQAQVTPRDISFATAWRCLRVFQESRPARTADAQSLYDALVTAIAREIVGLRPNRCEPRAIKRRPKPHDLLTVPRQQARKALLQSS